MRIQAIYANQASYPVFQQVVIYDILNTLKILVPNHLITQFSALIKLTRTRDAPFPYVSFLTDFTWITLGLQCQYLFLRHQTSSLNTGYI